MESIIQNVARSSAGTSGTPPVAKVGTLGKFGSFWMPKSPQEIAQRTGSSQGNRSSETGHRANGKTANPNAKTAFRDLISQKEGPRSTKTQNSPQNPASKAKAQTTDPKGARPKPTPAMIRSSVRLPIANAPPLNAKTLSPERVVADKHAAHSSSRRDLQDTLKHAKTQRDTGLHDEQRDDEEERRDHGAGNANHGRASQMQNESQETTQKSMNTANRNSEETALTIRMGVGVELGSKDEVASASECSSDGPTDRFLRSDEKSQRDARHVFNQFLGRVGSFIDGEARVARIAIDLPGGGRLGIKMRFVGDQLEVIFATEDYALRAALLEDWRHLSRNMEQEGALMLPPAFARENYDGIIRSEWTEAA